MCISMLLPPSIGRFDGVHCISMFLASRMSRSMRTERPDVGRTRRIPVERVTWRVGWEVSSSAMSAGRHALLSHVWESLSNIIHQPIRPGRGSGHQTCSCSGKSRPRCKVPPSTDLIHASRLLTSALITAVIMISATTGTQTRRLMDGEIQQSAAT